jgi:hypothetical protein
MLRNAVDYQKAITYMQFLHSAVVGFAVAAVSRVRYAIALPWMIVLLCCQLLLNIHLRIMTRLLFRLLSLSVRKVTGTKITGTQFALVETF